ncbi:Tol-Pal system beta propeller repeat protein TolB [Legionella israelensis]|nr:Tol-Pal system beta propeller repeat protein TolB [Legionella israelensis]QDP72817.1 Tol-Pal system beta propeller repeat protein TolB [Legionella israelensis]
MFSRYLASFLMLLSVSGFALDLELTQGINSALPIAVNSFSQDSLGNQIAEVIENDLRSSGQFKIVSGPGSSTSNATFQILRKMGADSVVSGQIHSVGGGHYEVNFELLDAVTNGKILLSRSYRVNQNQFRALAHHISDQVYQKLTGERGVFSTRIAYILVQRNAERPRYSLEVADADGYNPQSLLVSTEPIMSPAWSPDGKMIAYVTFEKKRAQIYTVSVETGRRRLITSFPGINGAPAWSPDGKELAVVLSKNGAPKIYRVDLRNGQLKQLTFGSAIDTEPRYAPDGRSLLFTSGRGGSPQVYRLIFADGSINRVTFEGNYNARASYTPDQKSIVMLHREDRNFNIAVQSARGGSVTPLTFSSLDESPSVSPNGRLVLYATRHKEKGVLGVVSIDGRIRMRLPAREGDVQEPAWSPYLG